MFNILFHVMPLNYSNMLNSCCRDEQFFYDIMWQRKCGKKSLEKISCFKAVTTRKEWYTRRLLIKGKKSELSKFMILHRVCSKRPKEFLKVLENFQEVLFIYNHISIFYLKTLMSGAWRIFSRKLKGVNWWVVSLRRRKD